MGILRYTWESLSSFSHFKVHLVSKTNISNISQEKATMRNPENVEHPKLTPRQWEVLLTISDGYSYKETGDILNITERTTAMHDQPRNLAKSVTIDIEIRNREPSELVSVLFS